MCEEVIPRSDRPLTLFVTVLTILVGALPSGSANPLEKDVFLTGAGLALSLVQSSLPHREKSYEEACPERLYPHRADDRRRDHRHPRRDRDPELHQVPGAV